MDGYPDGMIFDPDATRVTTTHRPGACPGTKRHMSTRLSTRRLPGLYPAQTRQEAGNLLYVIQKVPGPCRAPAGLLPGLYRVSATRLQPDYGPSLARLWPV